MEDAPVLGPVRGCEVGGEVDVAGREGGVSVVRCGEEVEACYEEA